jgi:FdhE protein
MTSSALDTGLVPGQSPEPLIMPDPASLFQHRARRLRHLAAGHSLGGWLNFVALLSDAQHDLAQIPPDAPPNRQWRTDLSALAACLHGRLPDAAQSAVESLLGQDDAMLSALARRLMDGGPLVTDLAAAPVAVAALQTAWTRHAAGHDPAALGVTATATNCPVCGGLPVAGVIHVGMQSGRLRYLHCGLCHTAWHHIRASCVACGDGRDVGYRLLEGVDDGVRAETCDSCKSYLKLLLAEKAPGLDSVADDLASLALDILVSEEGYRRLGFNPFLLQAG